MSRPTSTGYERELEVAETLAAEAADIACRYRDGDLKVELKAGDEPVTVADRAASRLIVAGLEAAFPDDVVISEERSDDLRRLEVDRVWYVDPIDGTKDFIRGNDGFSVMIGLTVGNVPTAGVVFQPVGRRVFSAAPDIGAWFRSPEHSPRKLQVSDVGRIEDLRLVASRSHRDRDIDRVKSALGIDNEFNIGSVGLKLSLIALAERDLYVNPASKCKTWDTCAPEAILHAAGGRMTAQHGAPLRYDEQSMLRETGMVASNGRIHDQIIAKLSPLFK
jgi:3'(2'), 5'-bisphosphate nucleotidase